VPRIAPCIPGVTLDEVTEDGSYEGKATVRLGPVSLSFAGKGRIERIDREARTARVVAEGADTKGRGRAGATVDFALSPHGTGTQVEVTSDITLTGAVAQYGRASGLIKEVANQIIADFTRNLEADLSAQQDAVAPASAKSTEATAPEAQGDTDADTAQDADPPAAARPARGRTSDRPAAAKPKAIGGFSVLGRAILAWFRGLFGR
jgi:carbon monoxide dehydrogenase subunit G